jgi:hypothetical protein
VATEPNTVSCNCGPTFVMPLTVVFVTLKLCGLIEWSWWWVWSPVWIPLAIVFSVMALAGTLAGIAALFER